MYSKFYFRNLSWSVPCTISPHLVIAAHLWNSKLSIDKLTPFFFIFQKYEKLWGNYFTYGEILFVFWNKIVNAHAALLLLAWEPRFFNKMAFQSWSLAIRRFWTPLLPHCFSWDPWHSPGHVSPALFSWKCRFYSLRKVMEKLAR